MIWLLLYLGAMMLCLKLVGIQAVEVGKQDWHWWFITLAVWFGAHFLIEGLAFLTGFNIVLTTPVGIDLSLLGFIASFLSCYGLYKWLLKGANSDKNFDKIDEIGKNPN